MDLLTALSNKSNYSHSQLQLIVTAWVLGSALEKRAKISLSNGDVAEDDYDKASLYSLLYAIYRSMGEVRCPRGVPYEFTFNTWGYEWPSSWGEPPTRDEDPQRFGRNAYTGLFAAGEVKDYVKERSGVVHVVEMGCGTGAGAHHVCSNVLPRCTYQAVDMQQAAVETCNRKFVPDLAGRLRANRWDATQLPLQDASADFVVVNETHVTEMPGVITDEDRKFFDSAWRILKPGGYLLWGNAIPATTWDVCFSYLTEIGFSKVRDEDVTAEAIRARDLDKARIDAYVDEAIERFVGFRIPVYGERRAQLADVALKNFARNPGTNLYDTMVNGTDSYRVVAFKKG